MMRPTSYIAIALAVATVTNVYALAQARSEQPAYLVIGTSHNPRITQTITVVRYGSRLECEGTVSQIVLHDTGPKEVSVTVKPFCTDVRPGFWVE